MMPDDIITHKVTDAKECKKAERGRGWFSRIAGCFSRPEPAYKDELCFIVRHDGEIMESTLRTFSCGRMAVWCLVLWREAFTDGTITEKYGLADKWFRA